MSECPTPKAGEFCWNELMTSNVSKAKEFYRSMFGWESNDQDMGHATYTMIKNGAKDIGGMMQIPKDEEGKIPPHWMSYIYVDNIDAMVERAKSLGATIKVPVSPAGEMGRFAVLQDPTGAHIALWQSTRES